MAMNWNPYGTGQRNDSFQTLLRQLMQGGGMPPRATTFQEPPSPAQTATPWGGAPGAQTGGAPPGGGSPWTGGTPTRSPLPLGGQGPQAPAAPRTAAPPSSGLFDMLQGQRTPQAPTPAAAAPPPVGRTMTPQTGTGGLGPITPSPTAPPGFTNAQLAPGYAWGKKADGTWVQYLGDPTNPSSVDTIPQRTGEVPPPGTPTGGDAGGVVEPTSSLYHPADVMLQLMAQMGISPWATRGGRDLLARANDLMAGVVGRMLNSTGFAGENPGVGVLANEDLLRAQFKSAIEGALRGERVFGSTASQDALARGVAVAKGATPTGTGAENILSDYLNEDPNVLNLFSALKYSNMPTEYRRSFMQPVAFQQGPYQNWREAAGSNITQYSNLLDWLLQQHPQGIVW